MRSILSTVLLEAIYAVIISGFFAHHSLHSNCSTCVSWSETNMRSYKVILPSFLLLDTSRQNTWSLTSSSNLRYDLGTILARGNDFRGMAMQIDEWNWRGRKTRELEVFEAFRKSSSDVDLDFIGWKHVLNENHLRRFVRVERHNRERWTYYYRRIRWARDVGESVINDRKRCLVKKNEFPKRQ